MAGTFNFGEVILQALDNQKRQRLQEQQLAAEQEYRNKSLSMQQKQMEQSGQQFQQSFGLQQKEQLANEKQRGIENQFRKASVLDKYMILDDSKNIPEFAKKFVENVPNIEQKYGMDLLPDDANGKTLIDKALYSQGIQEDAAGKRHEESLSTNLQIARMNQNSTLSALREQKMAYEKEKKDREELGWNSMNSLSKVVGSKAYVWGDRGGFNDEKFISKWIPSVSGMGGVSVDVNSPKQVESNTKGVQNYLETVVNPLLNLYDETSKKGLVVPGLQERLMIVGDKIRSIKNAVDKNKVSKSIKDTVYNKMVNMTPWINAYDTWLQQQADAKALADAKAKKQ